jgi:poly(hydroxyalkanoate) depolymerase family esterase
VRNACHYRRCGGHLSFIEPPFETGSNNMTLHSPLDMAEATRLTVAGRLEEAMVIIRQLHQMPHSYQVPDWLVPNPMGTNLAGLLERFGESGLRPYLGGMAGHVKNRLQIPLPEGASFEERLYTNQAGSRNYKLYVPSRFCGDQLPLVVMLHGCRQSPDDFAVGTRMNQLAEEKISLVAYPGQAPSANFAKCWNWFSKNNQQRGRGEPSLIAGITRQIMQEFAVDQARVYVAGLSAGGAAAAVMGSAYPDLYSAIGVHSGLACRTAKDLPTAFAAMRQGGMHPLETANPPLPTIVFHGDRDHAVSAVNAEQIIAQSGGMAEYQAKISRGQSAGGISYTRTVQSDETGRSILEQWLLHGTGHAWSGGSPDGSYTDPRGPDASREMLRFFLEHPRRPPEKTHVHIRD